MQFLVPETTIIIIMEILFRVHMCFNNNYVDKKYMNSKFKSYFLIVNSYSEHKKSIKTALSPDILIDPQVISNTNHLL